MLSAILPISMPVIPASPEESPMTIEEARLRFLGNKSCDMLMQRGILEIRKNPETINKTVPIITGVLNIRNTNGITIKYAICIKTCLFSLSEK